MSELKIIKNELATPSQWDNIIAACDYATYFHSREWAELWQKYSDGKQKPNARLITFDDATEVLYPMSVSKVSKGLLQQHISSPAWTYGGWLSKHSLSPHHQQLLSDYTSQLDIILRQNPFDTSFHTNNLVWTESDFTHVLDLSAGLSNLHKAWANNGNTIVRNANKARKLGITVIEARSIDDWRVYYEMYLSSQERWGKVLGIHFDWKLFELMYQLQSPHLKLWMALYEGQPISGAICTYQNKHVARWHAAAFQNFFQLRPVNLQDYEIIVQSCQEGYSWFDFLTSAGLEGVISYKARYGSEKLTSNLFINKRFLRRTIDNAKEIVCQAQVRVKKYQTHSTAKLKV